MGALLRNTAFHDFFLNYSKMGQPIEDGSVRVMRREGVEANFMS
jgi:hypothetical protein